MVPGRWRAIMKRIGVMILSVMMIFLIACGSTSVEASDKAISAGKAAISIGNDYIGHKITADEAQKKLEDLEDQMKYAKKETKAGGSPSVDMVIYGDILLMDGRIMTDATENGTNENYEKIKNDIKKIGEDIKK